MDASHFPQKSNGPILLGVEITLIIISTFVIFARTYVRAKISKAIGLDDYLALAAYILMMASAGLDLYSVANGTGRSINQLTPKQITIFFTLQPISMLMYFIFIGLIRLSILAFLPRLNRERWFMGCIWALAVVTLFAMLAPFFYVLTECKPILDLFRPFKPNKNCSPKSQEANAMYAHASVGIVTDIALFLLPIWVVFANMKFSKKIIQVTLVFGVGLFVIVTGIVRFVFMLNTDFAVNPTYKIVYVGLWTLLEAHVGLWCSSFPALQPLVRTVAHKLNLRGPNKDNKLSITVDTDSTPHHSDRSGNSYLRQNSAAQSTNSGATGILGGDSEISGCESAAETVEMGSVHDSRGTRMFTDMRVSVEGGKRCYVRGRTDFKEPWNPV